MVKNTGQTDGKRSNKCGAARDAERGRNKSEVIKTGEGGQKGGKSAKEGQVVKRRKVVKRGQVIKKEESGQKRASGQTKWSHEVVKPG